MATTLTLLLVTASAEREQEFRELCAAHGFDFKLFASVEPAWEAAQSQDVDLIFCAEDIDTDSVFDFCHRVHSQPNLSYCPVMVLTRESHYESVSRAMEVGITDIFQSDKRDEISVYLGRFSQQHQQLQGRILLVEDSISLQRAAVAALKPLGMMVVCATDVETAWYYFQEQSFDLAIVDLVLEGDASGQVLINRIRRLEDGRGDLPIMVMSSYDDEARRIQLYRSGVSEFLHKPVAYEELIVRARQLVLNWHLQEQVRRQNDELQDLNRSLQKFLGRVSHECRNAINVAMGSAKRILKRRDFDPRTEQQLQMIVNASEHQLALVNDIVDYSHMAGGELELNATTFSVADLIAETLELFHLRGNDLKLSMESSVAESVPDTMEADRRRLKQILMNLMGNALKFTASGSITLAVEREDHSLLFHLKDTGGGIAVAEQEGLFQAFTQTDSGRAQGAGTGLGLAICADFAQMMGGAMSMTSELGVGSCFTLTLPLNEKS